MVHTGLQNYWLYCSDLQTGSSGSAWQPLPADQTDVYRLQQRSYHICWRQQCDVVPWVTQHRGLHQHRLDEQQLPCFMLRLIEK